MKKFLVLILAFAVYVFGSGCAYVDAGSVGVKFHKFGAGRGIDNQVLTAGVYAVGINEQIFTYPIFVKQYPFTHDADEGSPTDESIYFSSKEGVSCWLEIGVSCRAIENKVPLLFQKYRTDIYRIIHVNIRQDIRDYINEHGATMSVEDLYGAKKTVMMATVRERLTKKWAEDGIEITQLSMLSDVTFPDEVNAAIIGKIKATQEAMQRQNEVQKANADAEISIARARGEAEAYRMKSASITPQMIELERIAVDKIRAEKWNGQYPQYMASSMPIPILPMNK